MCPEMGRLRRGTDSHVIDKERREELQPSSRTPRQRPQLNAKEIALRVAEAALEKKALQIEIIDVQGKVDYADYVVVMSGRSDRHVNAVAQGIRETMKNKFHERCYGLEGLPQGNWVLMDFGDVIVHIFHQDTRGYYDLEALWIDAARVDLGFEQPDEHFTF